MHRQFLADSQEYIILVPIFLTLMLFKILVYQFSHIWWLGKGAMRTNLRIGTM